MRSGARRTRRTLLAGLLAAGLVAGCGSDDSETGEEAAAPAGEVPRQQGKPLAPPQPKESIKQAARRIDEAVASDDCEVVNQLNVLSRPALDTEQRCESLQQLRDFELSKAGRYGNGGGLLEYTPADPERTINVVLVLDSDGLYHVALIDSLLNEPSVGTELATQFDDSVKKAVEAQVDGDCEAFLRVVHRPNVAGREVICQRAEQNPIATLNEAYPKAKPVSQGGTEGYGFYSYATPGAHWTIVMARQSESIPEGAPAEAGKLPKGASDYAYFDAYRTRAAQPAAPE